MRHEPPDARFAERKPGTINTKHKSNGETKMTTAAPTKSAADARKGVKTHRASLEVTILPNIAFDTLGQWAKLEYVAAREVPNDGEPFMVFDVKYLEGSLPYMTEGKDKNQHPLADGTLVSLKGNARLVRGFTLMKPGQKVIVEYLGKKDLPQGRTANDYNFDIIEA